MFRVRNKDYYYYYNRNNTGCFMLLLDAPKTFDRIEYSTLFNNLRRQDMCL